MGKSKERDINPAFTNVSHTVHHLTFGNAPRSLKASLPRQYSQHVDPLARQTFSVDKFHKARRKFGVWEAPGQQFGPIPIHPYSSYLCLEFTRQRTGWQSQTQTPCVFKVSKWMECGTFMDLLLSATILTTTRPVRRLCPGFESFHQGGSYALWRFGFSKLPTNSPVEWANHTKRNHTSGGNCQMWAFQEVGLQKIYKLSKFVPVRQSSRMTLHLSKWWWARRNVGGMTTSLRSLRLQAGRECLEKRKERPNFDHFDTFDFLCFSVVAMMNFPFWHWTGFVFTFHRKNLKDQDSLTAKTSGGAFTILSLASSLLKQSTVQVKRMLEKLQWALVWQNRACLLFAGGVF